MDSVELILDKRLEQGMSAEKCVLVVDDDPVSSYLVSEILDQNGLQVILAFDGKQALDLYNTHKSKIDLVIMDIRIPLICGYEATKAIKKINNDVPVLALTAHAFGESECKCRDAGCDEYLSKPFEIPEFVSILSKYITVS